jgi:phage shock protein A
MGFFDRLSNLWSGFLSLWISDVESRNPEAVYEAAINERIKKHRELKKAVSGIVYLRNKLAAELEEKEAEYKTCMSQLPIAIEDGDDELALYLIQQKDDTSTQIARIKGELGKVSTQAEEAKAGLLSFQTEIEKLKREKEQMLAKRANAKARINIQESLDGLSMEADVKALDNVREHISKLQAEADVGAELQGDSFESKMKDVKSRAANASARAQLEEMKKQMGAKSAAVQSEAVKKTI